MSSRWQRALKDRPNLSLAACPRLQRATMKDTIVDGDVTSDALAQPENPLFTNSTDMNTAAGTVSSKNLQILCLAIVKIGRISTNSRKGEYGEDRSLNPPVNLGEPSDNGNLPFLLRCRKGIFFDLTNKNVPCSLGLTAYTHHRREYYHFKSFGKTFAILPPTSNA